ncbi:7186_t:CDS:2, partial [Gigaspora margarita]
EKISKTNTRNFKSSRKEIQHIKISTVPENTRKMIVNWEFRDLWKTLDSKIKQLKKIGKVVWYHDPLTREKIQMIFQHEATSISHPQGGVNGNLDLLIIPVLPDPEGLLGPVHNIKLYIERHPVNYTCEFLHLKINNHSKAITRNKWYHNMRLGIKTCGKLMKSICKFVGIDIQGRDIVNHSGHTTLITSLYQAGMPLITSMAIMGHKSESSFRIYLRPSDKQKEKALSFLIGTAGNLPLNKSELLQDSEVYQDSKSFQELESFQESASFSNSASFQKAASFQKVLSFQKIASDDFRALLKSTTRTNLPLHSNAFIKNPTLGG